MEPAPPDCLHRPPQGIIGPLPGMPHTQSNLSSARRWTLLILLSLGMVIAYVDRINLSVALAIKDFAQHFSLTDADRGSLNAAFFWSYALAQIPAGWAVDRYGSKYP